MTVNSITGTASPAALSHIKSVTEMPDSIAAHFVRKDTVEFSGDTVSEAAEKLSGLMDENDGALRIKIGIGMSEEQLAEHFGGIGKQIDDAFAAGQITRKEYDELNTGLEVYTAKITERAERAAAGWEVIKERMRERTMAMLNGTYVEETRPIQEISKEINDEITEFVKNYCSINRSLLSEMISRVRGGQSLFAPGTVQSYTRTNTAGYFKNGYKPFVPLP